MTDEFRILLVCTANICRSPALELLLREQVPRSVSISSAGVEATDGLPVEPRMARMLAARGLDTAGSRSIRIDQALIGRSDLVLTMTRSQRSKVLTIVPTALPRCFTVREFLRLARPSPVDVQTGPALRRLVAEAFTARQAIARPKDDDIPDPYGRGRRAHARCLDAMTQDAARIVALLGVGSERHSHVSPRAGRG